MADSVAEHAVTSLRRFLQQQHAPASAGLDIFIDPNGNASRCALFGLPVSCDVSYDEVFFGRVLYEASFYGEALEQLTAGTLPLSQLYGISVDAEAMIKERFCDSSQSASGRRNVPLLRRLRTVARLTVEVMCRHNVVLAGLNPNIDPGFINSLCGIHGEGSLSSRLPAFEELRERLSKATDAFILDFQRGIVQGPILRMQESHGSVWRDGTLCDGGPLRLMNAEDGHMALAKVKERMQKLILRGYLDVQLGYTQPVLDSEPNVLLEQKDVKFGIHQSRLIACHGSILSDDWYDEYLRHVLEDLPFTTSPSGDRMLRVASRKRGLVYLLADKPIETVPFSPLEEKLVCMANYMLNPVDECLAEYCIDRSVLHNEMLNGPIDVAASTYGAGNGSAYQLHSDVNCLLTDDMFDGEELGRPRLTAAGIQVLTFVFSNLSKEHGVALEIYHPDDSKASNLVTSVPSYGPFMFHFQGFCLNLAKHKPTNANCPRGLGSSFRLVITFRSSERFQVDHDMLRRRLEHFGISMDRKTWVTAEDYDKHADGSPFRKQGPTSLSSVKPFPDVGVGTAATHGSLVAMRKRISLPSDRWPVHSSARQDGHVADLLRSSYVFSVDRKTWEVLSSKEFLGRLVQKCMYVLVDQKVKPSDKEEQGKEQQTERVQFGPLLSRSESSTAGGGGEMELVWPSTTFGARQTADRLSLMNKDQNHEVVRPDQRLASDIFLWKLNRNDTPGLIAAIRWWQQRRNEYEKRDGIIDEDDPLLDETPPEFWYGNSGGGSITAGEKGCPSLGSAKADKNAPNGFMAGGQKQTTENQVLDSVYFREAVVRVFAYMDPKDTFIKDLKLLPLDVGDDPVAVYVDTVEVYDLDHNPDSIEAVSRELAPLGLDHHRMKFSSFRTRRHTKHRCRSILKPRQFYEQGEWQPLLVLGDDIRSVVVRRPGLVDDTRGSGSNSVGTSGESVKRSIGVEEYLSPSSKHIVTESDLCSAFFEEEAYNDFLLEGDVDGDYMGELPSGMDVDVASVKVAMMHSSIANFMRMSRYNVYPDGSVGYLSGPGTSALSSTICLHSVHSPMRLHDLNTLTCLAAIRNTLAPLHGTPEAARKVVEIGGEEDAVSVMEIPLFGACINRITGRPFALEQWCKQRLKEVSKGAADAAVAASSSRPMPFYPTPTADDVSSFTEFMLRTCTDSAGNIEPSMTQWTGGGDAASIPPDLKKPRLFGTFVRSASMTISEPARSLVDLARKARTASSGGKSGNKGEIRESAVQVCKAFIESHLQKHRVRGSLFKANQVSAVDCRSMSARLHLDSLGMSVFSENQ